MAQVDPRFVVTCLTFGRDACVRAILNGVLEAWQARTCQSIHAEYHQGPTTVEVGQGAWRFEAFFRERCHIPARIPIYDADLHIEVARHKIDVHLYSVMIAKHDLPFLVMRLNRAFDTTASRGPSTEIRLMRGHVHRFDLRSLAQTCPC